MIYTVTLNPSIDCVIKLNQVALGSINRMESDDKYPGGKGINISRMLQRLQVANVATGFIGGFTGEFIKQALEEECINTHFIALEKGDTRINLKVKADTETEINGKGPFIADKSLLALEEILSELGSGDVVVFAGSAPFNLGNQIYKRLIALVKGTGAEVVCDFEGQELLDSVSFSPLLVKPNVYELENIFNRTLHNFKDIVTYARVLLEKGAKHVIVSMAGDGAILVTHTGNYYAKPIKGIVKNSVGAGDSMVAGFLAEFTKSKNPLEAFKWAVASGTATAFSDDLATAEAIQKYYADAVIEKVLI